MTQNLEDANRTVNVRSQQLSEAEKLTTRQREVIRSLTEKFEKAEDVNRTLGATITEIGKQNDCSGCAHIDANGKKLRPQKCACCRRGAKDNYIPDKPVAEANVISDDFLKSTEATT